jgi:hypothetical protein
LASNENSSNFNNYPQHEPAVNVDPDLGMSAAIDSIVSIDLNADVGVDISLGVGLDPWTRLWTSTIAAQDCHILPTQADLIIWDGLTGLAWI